MGRQVLNLRPPRICSACGRLHRIEARGMCRKCYRHARYARSIEIRKTRRSVMDEVTMTYCPDDEEFGLPMYPGCPLTFGRGDFHETLAYEYWPRGALFEYSPVYRKPKTLWRVDGCRLEEANSGRVAIAYLDHDQPRVRLNA